MAKKNSSSGVLIIILIVLALAIKYWQLFVGLGIIGFLIWAMMKLTGNLSKPQIEQSKTTNYQASKPLGLSRNNPTLYEASERQTSSVSPDSLWVPYDRTIQVAGHSITGGLFYFGSGLKSVRGWSEEPSLINPDLPVDTINPDMDGRNMGYWPSYSQINPASRAAFLAWLSCGKKDPKTNIGYVFIYFYGLERRALVDAKGSATAPNDIPLIVSEVKRLLSIYGGNGSFRGYASNFLDTLQVTDPSVKLYRETPQIETAHWEIPLTIKVAFGQMAKDNVLVPAEWALAWAENDPSIPIRMPAQRCRQEFRELFKLRYKEQYAEGMKLKVNKSCLQGKYRPASSSFGGYIEIPIANLPDLTRTTEPSSKIAEIVNVCTDELEGYSRYLGRNPSGKNSIEAVSYLPQPLIKKYAGADFNKLAHWLNEKISPDVPIAVPFSSIIEQVPSIYGNAFGKKEATVFANLLCKMSVGIEPDPRFGNFIPKPEQDVVIFKISDKASNSPSAEYSAATMVLHLATAVASADGFVDASEERHLTEYLETYLHLLPDEKVRLGAHTKWLLSSFPGMNSVKKRIELLRQDQRESLGRLLVGVAQADGYVAPVELKVLTNIYKMLGLEIQTLYSHAHTAAIEPVTVQPANFLKPSHYAIPTAPSKPAEGIGLDMSSVKAKLAETIAVSAMLNNIFTEDEPVPSKVPVPGTNVSVVPIAGLDFDSFMFMQMLTSKSIWTREELEKLAADHNLMLDGTLDNINDASYDHFGGLFLEGGDPIEINTEYAKEIAA
jgi:tellurite resistance protein